MPESLPLELGQEVLFDELGQEVSKHKCPGIPPGRHSPELHLDNGVSIQESGTRRLCNRRFSSGRDLERHMRAHGSLSLQDTALCDGQDAGLVDSSPDLAVPTFSGKELGSASLQPLKMQQTEKEFSGKSSTELADTEEDAAGGNSPQSAYVPVPSSFNATAALHLCEVCDKEFHSVTDLDLHRRLHPQYGLRSNPKRSRRFIDQDYTFDEATSSVPVKKNASIFSEKARACTECGKEFSSWKALFGHMRCHPEREWRGIQPPDNLAKQGSGSGGSAMAMPRRRKKQPSSTTVPDSPVTTGVGMRDLQAVCEMPTSKEDEGARILSDDESDSESIEAAYMNGSMHPSFHGWMTGKRSKRSRQFVVRSLQDACQHAASETTPATTPTEIKEEQDMANCLVMLACAGRSIGRGKQVSKDSDSVDSQDDGGLRLDSKEYMEASSCPNWTGRPPMFKVQSKHEKEVERDLDGGSLGEENEEYDGVDPGTGGCRLKYECTTCKRIFKSHQALGGHRASHKKVKGCFARTNMSTSLQEMQEEGVSEEFLKSKELLPTFELQDISQSDDGKETYVTKEDSEETMSVARKMKGHECSICHRVFTSGQALGGHKRCHWGGAGSSSDIASVVSNNKQHTMLQSGHTRGLKEKILDLNLPAPSDDPDYVHALAPLVSAYANRLASASILAERNSDFVAQRESRTSLDAQSQSHEEDEECNLYSTEERIAPEQGDEVVETSLTSTQNGMDLTQHTGLTEDGMEFSCTRYIRCNMCDRLFTSMEALCNHRKTHSAIMSSVTGLTPISA